MSLISAYHLPVPSVDRSVRVVVPYVAGMLWASTVMSVIEQGYSVELYPIERAAEHDYPRLLIDEWADPRITIIVEQDIVVPAGGLQSMANCEKPWCTLPYNISGRQETAALGCAKFDAILKDSFPDLAQRASRDHNGKGGQITWRSLDAALAKALYAATFMPHVHTQFPARHNHRYPESKGS